MTSLRPIAFTCALAILTACGVDGPLDPSDRPDLPPAAAFDADFSFFARVPPAGGQTTAWELALERIAAADAEMSAMLEVPLAALSAAAAVTPGRTGSTWTWPFDITVDNVAYDGMVRSTVGGSQYGWELIMTAPGHAPPLADYLWLSGISTAGGFEGQWLIADSDAGTNDAIGVVSWLINAQDGVNFSFSSSQTSVWSYERSATTIILTFTEFGLPRHRVTWMPAAGTGSTWTADTSLTQCWDANQHDVAC
jgi:hypothetical protein